MTDMMRRGLLGGAVIAGAAALAGRAAAQNAPQADPDAEKLQQQLQAFNDPDLLRVTPIGQDWPNLHRYRIANEDAVKSSVKPRAVFMGDSITDNWAGFSAEWFDQNNLIGRGIGGQTSSQMVVRFMADVVALKPQVVHIMAGTNDIAENLDPYDPVATTNNLMAMVNMATASGIKVVLASVPPATSFAWKPNLGNRVDMIRALNVWIKQVCDPRGHVWCDYWPVLANGDGGLKTELGINGESVHPNKAGYDVMGPVALAAVAAALGA